MSAGLQVFNQGYVIQIDSIFKNYRLLQKGVIPITWGNDDTDPRPGFPASTVVVTGSNPMIAMVSPYNLRTWREESSPGVFVFKFSGDQDRSGIIPRPFNVEYFVFDAPPLYPSTHGWGLQVFDANGQICFDSEFGYMKVIDFISSNASFPVTGSGIERSYIYSGYKVAVVTCQQALKVLNTQVSVGGGGETVPGYEFYSLTPRVVNTSTVVTLDRLVLSQIGSAVANINRTQNYMLVIDVTGI